MILIGPGTKFSIKKCTAVVDIPVNLEAIRDSIIWPTLIGVQLTGPVENRPLLMRCIYFTLVFDRINIPLVFDRINIPLVFDRINIPLVFDRINVKPEETPEPGTGIVVPDGEDSAFDVDDSVSQAGVLVCSAPSCVADVVYLVTRARDALPYGQSLAMPSCKSTWVLIACGWSTLRSCHQLHLAIKTQMPRVRYKAVIVHIELEGLGPIKNVDVCTLARNNPT
jgi:hypothetical protein